MVSKDIVQRVANLAKLQFDEQSIDGFIDEFNHILNMLETFEEVDTTNVKPTYHGNEILNVYREDVPVANVHYEDMIHNAPQIADGYIKVPAILESEEA